MSQGSNIIVADATTPTPVNHTYVWDGMDPRGISLWEDRSAGIPIGYWRIELSLTRPNRKSPEARAAAVGQYRCRIVVRQPYMETVSNSTVSGIAPAPTLSYSCVFDGTFVLPERSSQIAREHIAKMVPLILAVTQIKEAITNLDQPRG